MVLSFIAAFAIALRGVVLQGRRYSRLKCPECGLLLRREAGPDQEPITFICPTCNIEWDTGFLQSRGD